MIKDYMYRIGIIGIRGYKVIYSGFETFVKYLVNRSDKQHFYYYLFCRDKYQTEESAWSNISLISLPTLNNKYLETPIYSFFSNLSSINKKINIVLYLGVANTLFIYVQKIFGRKVIVNVDGLDWQRKRWNIFGKIYLRFCGLLTIVFADIIICDAKTVYKRYKKNYPFKKIVYIPYGVEVAIKKPGKLLKKFSLQPKKYIHLVGRLTPENCLEDIILAFKKVKTNYKCIIIGDSVYEDNYKKHLMNLAKNDKRIIFTGFLKRKDYEEVSSNSSLYVETKEIGGTHPSLIEAVAFGLPIIAKKINFHHEVLGNNGEYYSNIQVLIKKLNNFFRDPEVFNKKYKIVKRMVKKKYSWNKVILNYEELFNKSQFSKTKL